MAGTVPNVHQPASTAEKLGWAILTMARWSLLPSKGVNECRAIVNRCFYFFLVCLQCFLKVMLYINKKNVCTCMEETESKQSL